jgi:DNA mismatch repair protein MutL
VAHIAPYTDFFASQGIALHQAGPTTIAITSAPPKLQNSLTELVQDAADFIAEHETLDKELFLRELNEHVHSHMACKAAVRAGDRLDNDAMQSLVEQLMKTPNRFMCVHGRPTMLPFQRAELEKRFRRR